MYIVVQSPTHVWLFVTPRTAAHQTFLDLTISWSLLKVMPIASVMPSIHLILWCPVLLCLILPASGTFPISWLFTSGDQNTGASESVLPMSIQGWLPLRLTDLISKGLLSKGLSEVFSSTTFWRHQFFGALTSWQSSSHSCMWQPGRP